MKLPGHCSVLKREHSFQQVTGFEQELMALTSLLIFAASALGSYFFARSFVQRRLRFVDDAFSFAPLIGWAFLLAWPLRHFTRQPGHGAGLWRRDGMAQRQAYARWDAPTRPMEAPNNNHMRWNARGVPRCTAATFRRNQT
jgi:hypothetical protein